MIGFTHNHFEPINTHPFDMFGKSEYESVAWYMMEHYRDKQLAYREYIPMGNCSHMVDLEWFEEDLRPDSNKFWYRPTEKFLLKMWDHYGRKQEYDLQTRIVPVDPAG